MAKKTGRAVRPPAPFMLPQSTVGVPNNGSAATYKRWLSHEMKSKMKEQPHKRNYRFLYGGTNMLKIKQLKELSLTNNDVFLADLTRMRFCFGGHRFVVRNAILIVEENGKMQKLIPYKCKKPSEHYSGYEYANIKLGGISSKSNAFALKINKKRIKPDFVYAVLELERSEARFLGFSTFFTGERTLNVTERETITAEALLGIGYLEDTEDVEAAFALGERIAQDRILDVEPDADNNEDEGIITIRIGDE